MADWDSSRSSLACRLGSPDEHPLERREAPPGGLSLFAAWYDYIRVHSTMKTTPAVAHGIALNPWTLEELLKLSVAV